MSNLTDFFPSGGGGLTPKFEEFNASGTFTPTQALIDAGGYIEVFLVAGGGGGYNAAQNSPGYGGTAIFKKTYLTSVNGCTVTIGSGGASANPGVSGTLSFFQGSSAGGQDFTANGGAGGGQLENGITQFRSGQGVFAYGADGFHGSQGVGAARVINNTGRGGQHNLAGSSGYCLIKWYE